MNISKLDKKRKIAILNAALKEFATKGYEDASTNVIAKDAGISKALMFHYVGNKKELFLFVHDYFTELFHVSYFEKMDFSEKDIFARLRQSYLLQIDLLKQYPWIFELDKLSNVTKSDEINNALKKRKHTTYTSCDLFKAIDTSRFRAGLDIKKCKQFILWSNIGFTNQLLEDIRKTTNFEVEPMIAVLDDYFDELRKVFYE